MCTQNSTHFPVELFASCHLPCLENAWCCPAHSHMWVCYLLFYPEDLSLSCDKMFGVRNDKEYHVEFPWYQTSNIPSDSLWIVIFMDRISPKKESFQFVQVFSVPQITMSSCSRAKPLIQAETGDRLKGKLWKEISFILPHLIYGHRSGYRTQYVIFLWRVSISSPTQSTFGILSRCFLDASWGGKAWGGQRCVSLSNCWRCGNEGLAASRRKKLNMQEVRPIPHLKLRLLHPTPIFIISLFSFYFHSLLSFPKRSFIIWGNW